MRILSTAGLIVALCTCPPCPAREPPSTIRNVDPAVRPEWAALREASAIALKQGEHQHYWTERALLQIVNVQIRAGDFDGASLSIRGFSNEEYGRNEGLVKLAEALAGDGRWESAVEMLRVLGSDHGWNQDHVHDGVRLRWVEYLIAAGDLNGAAKAVKQLRSDRYRPDGFRKLAVAHTRTGDAARGVEYFTLASDSAGGDNDDFDRARALWETADAQLTVGAIDAAKATVRRLETTELKDPWAKVAALREAAVLAAKAQDRQTAQRLFRRAIEAREGIGMANEPLATVRKIQALKLIAVAQAGVGYIADAAETAAMIVHSEKDLTHDGRREEALYAVAVAQLKSDDVEGAVRTALTVEHFLQYRDDALHGIVDYQIRKRRLTEALSTAGKIDNASRKAFAILKIATAHARSGDRKMAADVAARIQLTSNSRIRVSGDEDRFDYRLPRSWGVCYDCGDAFTSASAHWSDLRAAEVAGAAMTLAQILGDKPPQSYAISFKDIHTEEVMQALARAHAASGDFREALSWAGQIGNSRKVTSKNDDTTRRQVQQRIHVLLGVAEGILDRSIGIPAAVRR